MKTTFEEKDIEIIVRAIVEKIKPLFKQYDNVIDDSLLTINEAAKFLNVKPSWLENNDIPGKCKIRGHVRYRKSKLIKWINEQEIPSTS